MKKSLELIKRANITGESNEDNIYRELRNIIEGITDEYQHPEKLSDEKYDMTDIIKRYGYSVDDYKKMFGSIMRSEHDVVKDLAKALVAKKYVDGKDVPTKPETPQDSGDDLELELELEAEAMLMLMRMKK